MEKKCLMEIVQAHQFLEAWLAGTAPKTEEEFHRFKSSISDEFVIIYPNGSVKDKETLISDIWNAHGVRSAEFSIEIREYQCRLASEKVCVATYEEWLHTEESSGRMSTAVFRLAPDGNAVEWVLVQETWLPKR